MIRFTATAEDGTILVGLGITEANVEKLKEGKPIRVTAESINLPYKVDFLIMYGETLESLRETLSPLIDKETQITVDPLLNTHAGERGQVIKPGHHRRKT